MEKYDNLGLVGEGSYGIVMKCRHKASGTLVAIKKFLESEEDRVVKRIANREIKMLRQLRHENLVNLIDVFKRKKKLYLVFEFVDYTLLDDLEKNPSGLEESYGKKILFQVLRGIEFCHNNDVIHRDIKPENILVSKSGIVKLCDFGFARPLTSQSNSFTDYVATRWYRAPELLVGDTKYGRPVDIWAIGCLTSEIFSGDPLFPGDSDIDQLFHIIKCIGSICPKHVDIFKKNVLFKGLKMPEINERFSLEKRYVKMQKDVITIIKRCLDPTPEERPSCSELLNFELFNNEFFSKVFINEIKMKVFKERERNPLLKNAFKSRASFSKNENFSFETNYKSPADKSPNQKRNSITLKQNPPLNENLKPGDLMYSENIISNQENEIVEPNIPTAIVDENTWEDVKLLTSRKERVASRAGRISVMKDAFINTEASEDTIDNTLQQSETPAMMDVPRPISNIVSSIEGDLDTKLPLNNDLSFNRLDNISKIHSSSSNIVSSEDNVNKSSDKVLATNLMQLKSVDNTQQEKAPLDVNANGSSPILNDIILMQPTPNISILSKKNHLCTLNNSTNINTFITSKHAPYNYPTLYQHYGSNPSLNFNVIKQMSTNFSQRALGVPSENALHSYFPNIGKDVKIRSNNFHFPAMAQSNKAFLNNNTNTGLKSPSPLTNERSGFYFNGFSKKKTFNNTRSTVIAYQDHNIILPELKGSEIPISRNQPFNPNTKYKYITQKVNNNSADPQNDKPHDP